MTAAALAATHALAFEDGRAWSQQEFTDLLTQNGVVLTGDGSSFILSRQILDEVEILTLATAPSKRRRGLAKANLEAIFQRVRQTGAKTVFLEVAADNAGAIALYQQAGFAQIASRSAYYTRTNGATVDALILQKKLDPA